MRKIAQIHQDRSQDMPYIFHRNRYSGVDFITRDPSTNGGLNGLVPQAQGYYDRKNTKDLLDEKTEYINRYVRKTTSS